MCIIPTDMNRFIIIFFLLFFTACQNHKENGQETTSTRKGYGNQQRHRFRGGHETTESRNIIISGDTVFVPAGSPVSTKLLLRTVDSQENSVQFTTTGVVRPVSGHKAEISVPFEGRIVKSFIRLGQKVKQGTPLFEVSSTDYLESVRMFIQAGREKDLAQKNYLRKKDLLESGISSGKEFDEARLAFDLAEKEYEKTSEILKIFSLNPEDADLTRPLIIRSPISGEIVQTNITVGQYIRSDSDPVAIVADLQKIWVIASVKENDLGAVSLQDQVEISTESMHGKTVPGSVYYIGNIMNEETRSVEIYIECDNPGQLLKCGMFVTARFYHKIDNSIIVPSSSVLQDYGKCFLFVQASPGTYIKREVTVISAPEKNMVVRTGLEPGNVIVSEGGIYLQ